MPTPQEIYENYLLNNPDGERHIEVVTISHSKLSKTYHLTPTPEPVLVTLETGESIVPEPVNLTVEKSSSKDDLDEKFNFNFDDIDGRINDEADRIPLDDDESVIVTYRGFMASDTSAPAEGPFKLNGVSMTKSTSGTLTIAAQSPSLVVNRTGELYTYERFPTLRGFL